MPSETNTPVAIAAAQTSATNHPGRAVTATSELTFSQALAQTAGDSWRATSWLIWLLLLLLLIILLLRRLERRHRRPNPAKPRFLR
jgi:flagellar biogenesis protein FliO